MNKDAIIKLVNEQMWTKTDADVPSFKAGDTITVTYKIVEGNKERLQSFRQDKGKAEFDALFDGIKERVYSL